MDIVKLAAVSKAPPLAAVKVSYKQTPA